VTLEVGVGGRKSVQEQHDTWNVRTWWHWKKNRLERDYLEL